MAEPDSLERRLGFWGGVAVVVGTTIGSGIFRKPATIAALIPDPRLILGLWALFGAAMLCGALALAELATMLPRAGGIYVYLRAAYGDAAAFVFGWLYVFVTVPAAIGALAMFFAELVVGLAGAPARLICPLALATIALLAAANVRGVRQGAAVQGLSSIVKVSVLVVLIAVVLGSGAADLDRLGRGSGAPIRPAAVALAASSLMWSHSGWQAISMVAGEVATPERLLGRIIVAGALIIVALYLGANLAYFSFAPADEIARDPDFAARSMTRIVGPAGGWLVRVGIAISVLGALNGQLLAKTRVPFALARDGLTFRALGRKHARWQTPYVAIVTSAAVAGALVLAIRDFDGLTTYFAVVEWLALLFAVAAVFVLRHRLPRQPRPFRTPGYPWTPLAFVAVGATGLSAVLWSEWQRGNHWPHAGLVIALAGFPLWWLRGRALRAATAP